MVGQLLDKLDELGIADNTIVMYSTDNGAEKFTWPDGGTSPFRGEKNTNWEGGYPRPGRGALARPDQARHDLSTTSWRTRTGSRRSLPRPASPTSRRSCSPATRSATGPSRTTSTATTRPPTSPGTAKARARSSSTSTTTAALVALRYNQWKIVFQEQRAHGFDVWQDPFTDAAPAQALQSPLGPVRDRRSRGDGLRPLEDRARLPAGPGAGLRRPVPGDLQGVPAAAGGRQLLARRG